ncbi:MAG TPA: hypothetical protein VNG31_01290 [Candidatus Baltobacteraceae bacterium]|nr:hypothetical protein [Candidatus Baltobacteraceae bacterium]
MLGLGIAACSGGGNVARGAGSLPSLGDGVQTVGDTADTLVARRTGSQNARAGIAAANALGVGMKSIQLGNLASWTGAPSADAATSSGMPHNGQCRDGVEFYAPDRNGDPNSSETIAYYDPRCTELARDDVRLYASTGPNGETVNHTDTLYAPLSATAIAAGTGTTTYSNATFGSFGIPNVAKGFAATDSSQLTVQNVAVATRKAEFIAVPSTPTVGSFCGDSAGYDPTGIASLDQTYGAQSGVLSGGSRLSTGNGFTTWSATVSGSAFQGSIGSLSIATGAQNTACPIAVPDFTVAGGTSLGAFSIPFDVTFRRGMLWSLTIINATLPGGDTLNVRTHRNRHKSAAAFLTGLIRNGSTKVASFSINAFGNGQLTIASTGAQYRIVDWTVVQ